MVSIEHPLGVRIEPYLSEFRQCLMLGNQPPGSTPDQDNHQLDSDKKNPPGGGENQNT
ncbi:hypothetical protein HOV93_06830 [Planctomycetes bacterium FF15]|uniref:Uncharacterized protein n=1 Tax=Bremerella alba TaxID=980252 RepID=A0A7V8V260_9BACT|nr:hypothetical protein [Bremerella alba]